MAIVWSLVDRRKWRRPLSVRYFGGSFPVCCLWRGDVYGRGIRL